MTNDELLLRVKAKLSEFERIHGVAPSIYQLAKSVGVSTHALCNLLPAALDELNEGTSAFKSSLRKLMFASRPRQQDNIVQLFDEDDASLGIVLTRDALDLAEQRGLMMCLFDYEVYPPKARLMDYGKFKFAQNKSERRLRRKYRPAHMKQITLRETIDSHDLAIKAASALNILSHGDSIELIIQLKRPNVVSAVATDLMSQFTELLADVAMMDSMPHSYDRLSLSVTYKPKRVPSVR